MSKSLRRIAVVRSVGGIDGLDLHAGMWQALEDRGIVGDAVYGTSAGAIASACDAAGWSAGKFANFVARLKDDDVRDSHIAWQVRLKWLFAVPAIWRGNKIRKLIARELPETWDDTKHWRTCPRLYATRMADASAIDVATPSIARTPADAVYASCAIPAVLPSYIGADGHIYRDGGIRRAVPLPDNLAAYDHVYVCVATGRRRKYEAASDLVSQALTLLQQLFDGQILTALDRCMNVANVTVLWPQPESRGGMLRFDHSLVEKARLYAECVLDGKLPGANGNGFRRTWQ